MALQIKDSRFVKVWKVKETDYGKRFDLGTSRKDKDGNYINTNWFGCRLVGNAASFGDNIQEGDLFKIVSGQLDNVYKKDSGKTYFNLTIFEAEMEGESKPKPAPAPVTDNFEDDDEFPF